VIYIVIAIVIGVVHFVKTTPPYYDPDEASRFRKAFNALMVIVVIALMGLGLSEVF